MKYLIIVPARSGSKGLPNKNVLEVLHKPLIHYTLEVAIQIPDSQVLVSSDSDDILDTSSSFNIMRHKRPSRFAQDDSDMHCVVRNVVSTYKDCGFEHVILLQPTSPLRTYKHVIEAIKQYEKPDTNMIVSVYKEDRSIYKSMYVDAYGSLRGLVDNSSPFIRRQDCPDVVRANGAIYIFPSKYILENENFLLDEASPYIMSKKDSLDIDTLKDLLLFEDILKNRANT